MHDTIALELENHKQKYEKSFNCPFGFINKLSLKKQYNYEKVAFRNNRKLLILYQEALFEEGHIEMKEKEVLKLFPLNPLLK